MLAWSACDACRMTLRLDRLRRRSRRRHPPGLRRDTGDSTHKAARWEILFLVVVVRCLVSKVIAAEHPYYPPGTFSARTLYRTLPTATFQYHAYPRGFLKSKRTRRAEISVTEKSYCR